MSMEKHTSLISRRNRVWLVETQKCLTVEKIFADRADAVNEILIYGLLENSALKSAEVIEKTERRLTLTYLPGRSYVELLEAQEASGEPDFAPWEALADWLFEFHRLTGHIMTDMNLRNFIFDDETGQTAGLDFEQCRKGGFEKMAAGLCAYTLLYAPEMSAVKNGVCGHLQGYFAAKRGCGLKKLQALTLTRVEQIRSMRRSKRGEGGAMEIGAVILCGGESRRMGVDKARLEYNGKTFLEGLCGELSGFPQRLISSGDGGRSAEGWTPVADILHGRGPMAGLYSALKASDCDALFVVSCDMPLVTEGIAREICAGLSTGADAAVPRTPDGICHPYCAAYRKSCAAAFERLFDAGDNCVLHALDAINVSYIEMDERPELTNINTPEEYNCLRSGVIPQPTRRLLQKSKAQ